MKRKQQLGSIRTEPIPTKIGKQLTDKQVEQINKRLGVPQDLPRYKGSTTI